jgi:hypothetical protein
LVEQNQVPKLSGPNSEPASVKDVFEIKPQYNTGHEPGLVAVLNRQVADSIVALVGKMALIRTPAGRVIQVEIQDVRDHGMVHSLFFKALAASDVPIGSIIEIIWGEQKLGRG